MSKKDQYDEYDEYEEEYSEEEYDEYDEEYDDDYSADSRAEYRHSRRVRNQAIVIVVTIILVLGILAGGFFGVTKLISFISEHQSEPVQTETVVESEEDTWAEEGAEVETPEA